MADVSDNFISYMSEIGIPLRRRDSNICVKHFGAHQNRCSTPNVNQNKMTELHTSTVDYGGGLTDRWSPSPLKVAVVDVGLQTNTSSTED